MNEPIIEETIQIAADNFKKMLRKFYPAQETEGFCEHNMTFQFIHAFLFRHPDACTFMELPYLNPKTGRFHHHIDGYIFNDEIGIFIESKQLYRSDHLESLMQADMGRLTFDRIHNVLTKFSRPVYNPGRKIYKLALAECWRENTARWWESGIGKTKAWDWERFLGDYTVGQTLVHTFQGNPPANLHWLWAYKLVTDS